MENSLFENTIDNLKTAIDKYLILEIDNENIDNIKDLCEDFKDFPETLFQFTNNHIIKNKILTDENKLSIIEFIDGDENSLEIKLNEILLFEKLKILEQTKNFDKIVYQIKKYNIINNILYSKLKEQFLIITLRVYTKNHLFNEIINLHSKIKLSIGNFNFNSNQENKLYNYLARAYAYINDNHQSLMYINKAKETEYSTEIEIRNYRYATLCYWKIENDNCIDTAKKGIDFIDGLEEKEKYRKYYSDLNRLLSASYVNNGNLSEALVSCRKALEIIQKVDYYYYEKFWISFLECAILRRQEKFKEAELKIKKIEINPKYIKTIKRHPEAKPKIEAEKIKINICQKTNLKKSITTLNSSAYKKLFENDLTGNFNRYLMLAEAYHYSNDKQNALDCISTARVFAKENNKILLGLERYLRTKKIVEDEG